MSGQLWVAVLGLAGATVVARVLGPELFGVYFLALTISSSVAIGADLCVGQAILTRVEGYAVRYALWRRLAVGLSVLGASITLGVSLFFAVSPYDGVMWLILCAALPLTAASMIPRAFLVLQGQLRFVSIIDVVSVGAGNFVAVTLVLVWPTTVAASMGPFIIAAVRYLALEWAFRANRQEGKPVSDQDWRTGLRVLWSSVGGIYMSQLSGFASRNGGNLIVSLLLGPANLAFYSRAFSFLVGPLQQAQMALNPLMLRDAADARIQGQTEPYLAKLVPRLFALMLPVSATIGAMGPELTLLLLGPAWAEAGELMTISAGLAISMTIALPARWILVASRDSRKLRIDSLLQFSLLGGCAIGAALWGLQGSMIINAVLLGPVIAVADWMLLSPTARAFFWRRGLPIAVSLSAIPFLFVTVAKAVTTDSLQTVLLGLVAGAVTTVVAFAIFERDRLRAATSKHKTEGQ